MPSPPAEDAVGNDSHKEGKDWGSWCSRCNHQCGTLLKKKTSFEPASVSCKIKMTAANAVIALFYSGIAPGKIHIFRRFFDTLEWAG